MYVYLDHAQIAALDLLHRREPTAFADFLALWLEHGCRLVVSRANLHEIGQSEDERDVEMRLEVLRHFSLWSGAIEENVDWVVIREILHQTLHRLNGETKSTSAAYAVVREELYRPVDNALLREFVRRSRVDWLNDQRLRREFAAFENRSLGLRQAYRKLARRKEPKWDPEGWRMMPMVRRIAPTAGGDPVADRWMKEVELRTPECWKQAKRKRHMLVCIYDIADLDCVERAPEQDLSRIGFYRALANRWVAPYCHRAGHDPEEVAAALRAFDPYDAPAISASLAVERGRKLHEKEFEAGDFMDADHVVWAAYADLTFVDRRTHGFLLQAKKNRQTAQLISKHLPAQFERAATLDDVKRHINTLASEGGREGVGSGA